VVTAQLAVSRRGVDGAGQPTGRERLKRAVSIAIGTLALGAVAGLLVLIFENHILMPAPVTSVRAQLPADLFTAPRAPMPRVVVRYTTPRSTPSTAVAPTPAKVAPTAAPTPSQQHHPSPSPSPSPTWGGDD
jgi:hypothetical protein